MDAFGEIREGIERNMGSVLEHFRAATREDPWIKLPQEYHANNLEAVARGVVELALRPPEGARGRCRTMLWAAAEHGEERLKHGFDDSLLFRELYLLRTSMWHHVHGHQNVADERVFEAILRVDGALTLATRASVRGYYRPTYEARGEWPRVIERMVREWKPAAMQ